MNNELKLIRNGFFGSKLKISTKVVIMPKASFLMNFGAVFTHFEVVLLLPECFDEFSLLSSHRPTVQILQR